MKTKLLTTAFALLFGGTMTLAQSKTESDKKQSASSKDLVYYTCSMHPEVKMDEPGKCPKCGMVLEKKTMKMTGTKGEKMEAMKVYTCSMHPDVRSDKPGKCPKCGMDLMEKKHDMMESMSSKMGKMNDMKMTGDFDLDFANMMIMHHQAAVDMSEVEIDKGTDEQIKTMAKNIITAQNAEIGQLRAFIESYKMPDAEMKMTKKHDELTKGMKTMKDKMNKMKMTGNADKDFVMMMIPHHETAVKMAKDELSHGKQPGLKKMAQKMIADQSKEIDQFKSWRSIQK